MARSSLPSVRLSADDREWLTRIVRTGAHPAQEVRRSRILLELDESVGEPPGRRAVAERVGVDPQTITNVARAYIGHDGDVGATIRRKKRSTPPVEPIVTGEVEARLIALGCSTPPAGRSRWSLRLLEKQVALMDDMPDLDHSTIGRIFEKRRFVLI
ncbi:helix-turn-helix domain-containing protein [Streptomyces litchfieldiae]|uniref:Helix-turn-helix domain-containing protein n=1 Tax=Streptomyces litchfieldiae TaxID=3075543 RepID=A0ABU2N128_9ACTN|nr:helix-turn-helix domain-containing protein [Streptomyces sp. DSM 44938]MDT0346778.1 helix-turn-helix domain-containing protein [Streptomyces sp. DSM 44938]